MSKTRRRITPLIVKICRLKNMGYFEQLEFKEKLNDLYDEYKLSIRREEIAEILREVADSID